MKIDENDYTEGWDTTTGDDDDDNNDNDDEYMYDDRADHSSDTVRSESSSPVWLQGSDDYNMVTGQKIGPQRIYLNRKKPSQIVTRLNKDKRVQTDEEALMHWTSKDDNFDSSESMMESEMIDDGWMISKRRRVITNGGVNVIS
ncbi:hypothetical protein LOAG_11554 [Loa loa]|nr:hypothetical protein LOAG_11554 [Loa loa]EFO16950.1 hypothetical protein LOAG_11554 [Loa loa]